MIPNEELAYLAGFFDGEGSIIYAKRRSQTTGGYKHSNITHYYAIEVQLGQCDEYHPRLFQSYFGGSVTHVKPLNEKWHEYWAWRVASKQAYHFLKVITPYLRLKQPQAKLALDIQERKFERNYRKRTDEQVVLEEADRILMQNLNKPPVDMR